MDECLPIDLRHHFRNHDAHTTEWAGLKGKKNGDLLSAAEVAGYESFLTVDQGIPHQQHQAERKLSIILVRARTNRIDDLVPFVGAILEAIDVIQPGQTIAIRSS